MNYQYYGGNTNHLEYHKTNIIWYSMKIYMEIHKKIFDLYFFGGLFTAKFNDKR